MAPSALDPVSIIEKTSSPTPQLTRLDANSPTTTSSAIIEVLHRDGGVIVENLFSTSLAAQIKSELKPYFDTDRVDKSGFFPETTQRASGLIGISPGCVEYLTTPLLMEVVNEVLSSTYSYWLGEELRTVTRCVAAITKSTKENGATVVIPGSHTWGPERSPKEHETVPAELDIGGALIFFGNTYHAGGRNITTDQARETVGLFFTKGFYRQAENQYLMVPVEKARGLSNRVKRLLGYGISPPGNGFYQYQDPMRMLYGVEDEEIVEL
ncbi:hypothetical protein EG329_013752 [Mollisiaceae sp. DMI_Dod_QoI]|nr:hypothetical protein EG329_013752 [Helotiales sp. DMI_Dod_QoI]